jgi:hypothetical protein
MMIEELMADQIATKLHTTIFDQPIGTSAPILGFLIHPALCRLSD